MNADYSPAQPTDNFSPAEAFHVAAHMVDIPPGTRLQARWRYNDNLITLTPFNAEQGGTGWVAFQLSQPTPWPVGKYQVDILMGDRVLGSVPFEVRLAP